MNNPDNHIDSWSNTDVQKYLKGELSAREMHALEKLALDDPFLADALEGLQTSAGPNLFQDLSELRTRLDARVAEKRKTIIWPFLRVAAAIILLVGLGYTVFYTFRDQKPRVSIPAPAPSLAKDQAPSVAKDQAPPIAANQASPVVTPPAEPAPAPVTSAPAPQPSATAKAAPAKARTQPAKTIPLAEPATSDHAVAANALPQTPQPQTILADSITYRPNSTDVVVQGYGSQRRAALQSVTIRGLKKDTAAFQDDLLKGKVAGMATNDLVAFSGRVLDLNHRPLAGANLMYKSNSFGFATNAVTDQKGYFNLYVPQKDTAHQLTVAMEGYEETKYALNTEDRKGNTIFLRQSPARLDEVVVSGIGAKRKEYLAAPPSDDPETLDSLWLNAAPAMGRIAYLNYLATTRKTLPVDTAIRGTESISFLVDKKGALTEFKIERSLSPAHDAGVIRLITEGPPWQMIHGRKARALVNVTFP